MAKKLNLQFIWLYLRYICGGGGGWLKNHMEEGVCWKRHNTPSYGAGI